MNTAKLRTKRVIVTTTAAVAALAIGGGVWATAANADVRGEDRDRLGNAAVQAVGGGTVTDVDTSDDKGEAYEVEVRKQDGSEIDVALDKDGKVIGQQADTPDSPDADDRVLTDAERTSAEQAAVAAVTGGTVTDVEASDDPGVAYEVEVRAADNSEWDVELDTAFKVVTKTADN
ncbi:PepSY domain-containing protein [Actinoplanes sp. NPDC051494]|uniref:PepSY domain-containing protein n=1 Tax=Actinoplanes sp. NPDC051494 TaxID=3363907 RepID=UPI003795145A